MSENIIKTRLTLRVPADGSTKAYDNFSYSNFKLDASNEALYNFATGIMAFQANKGTDVTVTRESELA